MLGWSDEATGGFREFAGIAFAASFIIASHSHIVRVVRAQPEGRVPAARR
jgi:hypothetical protein